MSTSTPRPFWQFQLLPIAAAMLVSAYAAAQSAPPAPETPRAPESAGLIGPGLAHARVVQSAPAAPTASARAYRQDCAMHLYTLNIERIYQGRMRPLLYAIGVLRVEIDPSGQVSSLDWLRAPSHAPEVMADIERTIRQAAPFPAPAGPDKVVYTDTWLWDKSGQFQLDTLTEGQD